MERTGQWNYKDLHRRVFLRYPLLVSSTYLLGGLIARYVVGLMYSRGLFEQYTPTNFTTFATPHLGLRHVNKTFLGQLGDLLGPKLLSASGRQMYLADSSHRPLLLRMAEKGTWPYIPASQIDVQTLFSFAAFHCSKPVLPMPTSSTIGLLYTTQPQ